MDTSNLPRSDFGTKVSQLGASLTLASRDFPTPVDDDQFTGVEEHVAAEHRRAYRQELQTLDNALGGAWKERTLVSDLTRIARIAVHDARRRELWGRVEHRAAETQTPPWPVWDRALQAECVALLGQSLPKFSNALTEALTRRFGGRARGRENQPEPVALDATPEDTEQGTLREILPDPDSIQAVEQFLTDAHEARLRDLADLTASEERVWVLAYYRDLPPQKIAERRGVQRATIDVQLSRAREKLRTVLRRIA